MWGGPLHNQTFIEKILEALPSLDKDIYGTTERIEGMLTTAYEEDLSQQSSLQGTPPQEPSSELNQTENSEGLSNALIPSNDPAQVEHHPFYFMPSVLAKTLHCQAPSEAHLRGALRHAGYRATRSHAKAGSIRTDAPWGVLWEIMREWVRQKAPIKESSLKEGTPGWRILRLGQGAPGEKSGPPPASEGSGEAAEKQLNVVFDEELGREGVSKRLKRYQHNPRPNWGPMARAKSHAAESGSK
jgi:tRNA (guanine26-N2/guanine27-N2)-dimethyltransferase